MLPGFSPAFQAYVAPARERAEIWRTLLGLTLIALIFVLLVAAALGASFLIAENIRMGLGYMFLIEARGGRAISATIINLGAIVMFLPAMWLVLRFLHKRPLLSVIGPNNKIDWPIWRNAFVIFMTLGVFSFAASYLTTEITQQMPVVVWLKWAGPVLLLIFLQTTTEEMLFRGYLQQQLAARFNSRIIWWVIPSMLFGLVHYNSTTFGGNAWLVVVSTTFTGLILADITARFGTLSAAMGLHFANNAFVMLFLNTPGQMSGSALFLHEMDLKSSQATAEMLASLLFILSGYGIFLIIMHKRRL